MRISARLSVTAALLATGAFAVCLHANARLPLGGAPDVQKPTTGIALKRPVFGGACKTCPWGAMAEIVKTAMAPYGYDVQICYNCAGSAQAVRYVAGRMMPPPLQKSNDPTIQTPPPPNGPVDFGAVYAQYAWWGYLGTHDFEKEGAHKDLRLLANIQDRSYMLVAVKTASGISDLRQIREKGLKVRILTACCGPAITDVLNYYGLSPNAVEAAGGRIGSTSDPDVRKNFDVIVGFGALNNTPEYNVWYEATQKSDLMFLPLPEDLLAKLAQVYEMERRDVPDGLLRGIDHPIATVVRTGTVIYGLSNMPDDFAYTVAKALDEHQDLLQWSNGSLSFSYNSHDVWKAYDLPLHPGAARYYRERGYMP